VASSGDRISDRRTTQSDSAPRCQIRPSLAALVRPGTEFSCSRSRFFITCPSQVVVAAGKLRRTLPAKRGDCPVKHRLTPLVLSFAAVALLLTGPASTPAGADLVIPPGGTVRPDLHSGDVASDGYAAAVVPQPGNSVWSVGLAADGNDQDLGIQTLSDGTVVVFDWGDDSLPAGGISSGSPAACNDPAYNYMFGASSPVFIWTSRYDWYFKADSVPSDVDTDNARQAVRNATAHITGADSNCSGLSDNVSATAQFQGDTVRGTNISTSDDPPSCEQADGYSVTMYGELTPAWIAWTCIWWTNDGVATESDAKMNKVTYKWYAVLGSGCTNRYSTESIMTHERGHTFGLGHVSEQTHANLTMSKKSNGPCQDAERSLGLGDVRGLESLY
jgi:hypothetical protein